MYIADKNKCSFMYCHRMRDWLNAKKQADKSFRDQEFAADVGLSSSRLSDIKNDRPQFVSPEIIHNIGIATNEAVTLADYIDKSMNPESPEETDDE